MSRLVNQRERPTRKCSKWREGEREREGDRKKERGRKWQLEGESVRVWREERSVHSKKKI